MTKREESWAQVLLIVIGVTVSVVWNLNASGQVHASQISGLSDRVTNVEALIPAMGSEVTQIRITLEAAEISRQHLQRTGEHNGP